MIRNFTRCKSPDFDGSSGNGFVDLSDLIEFAREFNGQQPPGCHDYDNNNSCDLGDLVIFSPAFVRHSSCQ